MSEGGWKGWLSKDPSNVVLVEAQLVGRGEGKEEEEHHQLSIYFVPNTDLYFTSALSLDHYH